MFRNSDFMNWLNRTPIITEYSRNYQGNTNSTFFLQNDFIIYPSLNTYKILDNYDSANVIIETKERYSPKKEKEIEYEQWHNISFRNSGTYKIQIMDFRTHIIKTLTFTIS